MICFFNTKTQRELSSFLKSVWLFVFKRLSIFFAFLYIKTCKLYFVYGSHCNFHSYTKTNFFAKRFYTKRKKSILFTYGIPRALLSNKIVFAFLQKVNNSIATKLCVNLINNCTIFSKKNNVQPIVANENKTVTFSTRALIWVHFKTVHYFS